jgi:hypothetical protein
VFTGAARSGPGPAALPPVADLPSEDMAARLNALLEEAQAKAAASDVVMDAAASDHDPEGGHD